MRFASFFDVLLPVFCGTNLFITVSRFVNDNYKDNKIIMRKSVNLFAMPGYFAGDGRVEQQKQASNA